MSPSGPYDLCREMSPAFPAENVEMHRHHDSPVCHYVVLSVT